MSYDSRPDTYAHISQVREFLLKVIHDLMWRAQDHDMSKLEEPEKSVFDVVTPKLKELTYDSPEYKASLAEMGEALKHHYEVNDHHPEHFPNGISDMNLMQIMEMLCDWKAATLRHADGNLRASIEKNAVRFGYGWDVRDLLMNTAEAMGWLESKE